ncbi:MAG: LysE family translocator [Proteobacteria bacterium]|nr:LysE family translocator [Pseudomonadota bacterium]
MLTYFLIGALIGALTGVPIGPVNVAVIDTAYRHTLRRAIAVGFGGAIGDGLYAMLGILGMGPFLEDHPGVPPILYAASGLVLLVYGVLTARSKPLATVTEVTERASEPSAQMWSGFVLGFSLIILNPAAIVTWVVIVGSSMPEVSQTEGIAATIGVSCGSFVWFALVAYLANHGKKVLGGKAVWITRIVGLLLIAYALFSLGRAIYIWFF